MLLHKVFQYSAILLSNIYWGCLIVKGPNSYSGIYQVSILENYLEEEIDSTLDCENQFHDFKLLNHWPSTSYNSRHLINSQKKPHEESKQNKVIHFRKKYNSEYFIEYTNNIIIVQHTQWSILFLVGLSFLEGPFISSGPFNFQWALLFLVGPIVSSGPFYFQ